MFVVAVWVIVAKAIQLSRAARANARFIAAFRQSGDEAFLAPAFGTPSIGAAATTTRFDGSPLYAMFQAASQQVRQRVSGGSTDPSDHRGAFGDKAMNSIRAAIDATAVRETNRLNRLIVLLTIAISGGPFIGLLGTVVGVMITFAIIAKSGEVDVNSIAPGIASALLATTVGLLVAIPALFMYSFLNQRIKGVIASMQVFIDEFVAKVAEFYPPPGESGLKVPLRQIRTPEEAARFEETGGREDAEIMADLAVQETA
jgi:biopolymer transport protein ExbB